jgi:hypothetical protein
MDPLIASKGEGMITKPEKIKKRILKAIGKGQSVLIVGKWEEEFINQIKENNSIVNSPTIEDLKDNTFTRIVIDYSLCDRTGLLQQASTPHSTAPFYNEARRLLLPTGMLIISANTEIGFIEKMFSGFKKEEIDNSVQKIKPKVLQDQIHDNGFLIDGYYGYPGGDILMMAVIQNKEVSTLFGANKQETVVS